jgi:hypothetical protein
MKFVMDGHEYSYNDETRELKNNYGVVVAEIFDDDVSDEYYYPEILEFNIDDTRQDQPAPIHKNVIQDNANARGMWILQTYVASTT